MRAPVMLSLGLLVACSSSDPGSRVPCESSSDCPAGASCAGGFCESSPGDASVAWAVAPTQVATGHEFSCLLDANASVYCWGDNTHGQLGRGNTDGEAERIGPVQGLPDDVVQICAGDAHACARTGAGEVWCWGDNMLGEIGNGATTSEEPMPVLAGISGPAVDVAAGENGTCAALMSGEVQCWGHDYWRILGRTSTQAPEPSPTLVTGVTDAIQIRTSGRHACARQASGTVICWGSNWWGEVGQGTVSGVVGQPPVAIPELDASDITLGVNHTCAVTESGMMCWGDDRYGQIGNGQIADGAPESSETRPAAVMEPPGSPFVAISAGGIDIVQASTCAIGDDGTGTAALYCWGADQGGAFGSKQASPRKLVLSSPATVSVGPDHSCAIAEGRVYCWGHNRHGELGDGTTTNRVDPVAVLPP